MIVVDVNVLVYSLAPGPRQAAMQDVLRIDSGWVAPRLWRSEFRNFLSMSMRRDGLTMEGALELYARAETVMGEGEFDIPTPGVLERSRTSRCTAYDCEYVVLAETLGVPLVTGDRQVLDAFPGLAITPEAFVKRGR